MLVETLNPTALLRSREALPMILRVVRLSSALHHFLSTEKSLESPLFSTLLAASCSCLAINQHIVELK